MCTMVPRLGGLVAVACVAACAGRGQGEVKQGDQPGDGAGTPGQPGAATPTCPASAPAASPLPGVEPSHRTLEYWLARTPDLDEVVLDVARIRDLNASFAVERPGDWHGGHDLTAPVDAARVVRDVGKRLEALHGKLAAGDYIDRDGAPLTGDELSGFEPGRAGALAVAPELRVALDAVPIRCGPRGEGFFAKPSPGSAVSARFDRNNCSTVHPQEVVQILATWPNGMKLARTRYATGWIAGDAPLSPPLPDPLRAAFVHGPRVQADDDLALKAAGGAARCPAGTLLPVASGKTSRVHFASTTGFHDAVVGKTKLQPTRRPLTRRALLVEAFRFLDTPYGWGGGGTSGGHDCSGFLMDLFAAFDLRLPRHSSWQARAGTFSIDISEVTADDERRRLIDAAAKKGVVLLNFPGHVMLYLGRTEAGTPMVIQAIAEYAAACPGGGETVHEIDRVTVSDLELGRGSSRRSLLERITHITVIGKSPGVELAGAAELRPAAPVELPAARRCRDSEDVAIFTSPRQPNAKQPLRVIVTANRDPGPAELALFDPAGRRVTPSSVVRLHGGPPWSMIATIDRPRSGAWTAVLGDGSRVEACERIGVKLRPPDPPKRGGEPTDPVWAAKRAWGRATENLYATFVQRLFDFPPEQDLTWPDLHTLLRDPARNLLFDHLQRGEEGMLRLRPDCADLPYVLRAYFAWKLNLPFAYYRCNRGSSSRAPLCKPPLRSNLVVRDLLDDGPLDPELELNATSDLPAWELAALMPEEADGVEETEIDDIDAFAMFWGKHVARTVHSSSGRTVPDDEVTDYYPVPLTRAALKPGTVYIDPFGHVMVIAGWIPQGASSYGVLLAADAQPDGTVGRKRFWRGNFLFTPETKVSGAGFKMFRPAVVDDATRSIKLMENKELARSRVFPPFSRQQYEGSADKFHDTIESMINPRPLDASGALGVLVDALHSQAKQRVVSVGNGEKWIAARPNEVMAMPEGADIFLTSGPWEDFATPSRDFRLLVAIDTVLGFAASVKRAPARFGLEPGPALDAMVAKLDAELAAALAARTIEYPRSDGRAQTLTLQDLVDRRAGFEMSYNPNDCVEIRWGAPEGSPERATCRRHAPAEQRAKMERYREWFRDRRRPAR
jgi:hypothetical protein